MINMIRGKMEHLGSTPSLIGGERKTGKLTDGNQNIKKWEKHKNKQKNKTIKREQPNANKINMYEKSLNK